MASHPAVGWPGMARFDWRNAKISGSFTASQPNPEL